MKAKVPSGCSAIVCHQAMPDQLATSVGMQAGRVASPSGPTQTETERQTDSEKEKQGNRVIERKRERETKVESQTETQRHRDIET